MKYLLISVIFVAFLHVHTVLGSLGDNSPFYQRCVKNCRAENCSTDGYKYLEKLSGNQDIWSRLLFWNCKDECQYQCMWRTVDVFRVRNFAIPKFHGKWPFKKRLGVQEPGSAFASLLNLAAHVYMCSELKARFPVKSTPLVLFWYLFAAVCIHAWLWSTIFHTKDNPFTEFMDYACALSMVIALGVAALYRVFHRRRKLCAILLLLPFVYYIEHVRYLYSGQIDYDYNMKVNVFFGVVGSIIWLLWSCFAFASGRRYAYKMASFTVLSGAALALELFDFPPKYDTWDAHALWHLATAPLPLLFYGCIIDDLYYLESQKIRIKLP